MSTEGEVVVHEFENSKTTTAEELLRQLLSQMWETDNPESYLTLKTEQVSGEAGPTVVYRIELFSINGIKAKEEAS